MKWADSVAALVGETPGARLAGAHGGGQHLCLLLSGVGEVGLLPAHGGALGFALCFALCLFLCSC